VVDPVLAKSCGEGGRFGPFCARERLEIQPGQNGPPLAKMQGKTGS
jgi:hypothetical protein